MTRIINILLGIGLVFHGISILDNPVWNSDKLGYRVDITGYNIPIGIILILLGLYTLYKMLMAPRYTGNDILMCHQCNQPIERKQTRNNKCPTCDVELEPLDGFYDRHPELKGK